MPAAPAFDAAEALRFLEHLELDPARVWFRSIKPGSGANVRRRDRQRPGWAADLHGFNAEELAADARDGSAIYFITGHADTASGIDKHGNPTGCVIDADVHSCSLLFLEWDNKPVQWQINAWRELGLPEPSAIVPTGGKSAHNWWRLAEPMEPDAWRRVQSRLIDFTGADTNNKNPSRLMRLPGAPYFDKATRRPTGTAAAMLYTGPQSYRLEEIKACIPELEPELDLEDEARDLRELVDSSAIRADLPPRTLEEVNAAAEFIPVRVGGKGTYTQDRNALCGCSAALAQAGCANPDAAAVALLGGKWPSRKAAEQCLASTTTRKAASFWAIAGANGYDLRRQGNTAADFKVIPGGYDQGRDGRQRQGQQQGQPQGRDDQQQRPGPYQVLGWCKDRDKVWYRHRQTAQIASVKPSGQAELLKLADLSYWGDRYPRQDKDGNKIMGINWARAAADLIKAANNAGVFQLEKMRGRGVWLDGGQVVWHLGHALEVDGKPVSLTDYRSAHQYALMQSLPIKTQVEPLDDAHGQKILKVLRDCAWIGASDHLHLAGFCVLSSVCGALNKRPGLQITSPFSSGKTDTIDNVIMPLQGGIGLLSSGSTEAGVRQLLGSDALPATIDESEAEEGRRREAQLRLVRFSYDGKPQFKGTPGQGALTYCLRSSLALAGINSPIDNPADGSRIAIISRRMLPADQWAVVTRRRSAVITQEIGQRLIRRTVSTLPALQANIATFKEVITAMVTTGEAGRTGDTWGALLAGAHHLVSTQAISKAEAAAWLDSVGWHLSHTDADEQDRRAGAEGRQCLDHLLSHETRWIHPGDRDDERPSTGSVALRELTALVRRSFKFIDKDEAEKELGRKGIRVMLEGLAVANHAPGTAVIFSKTKWANGAHKARLLELDGATRSSGPIHFACSGSRRAVLVPWAAVGDLGDEEAAQAA